MDDRARDGKRAIPECDTVYCYPAMELADDRELLRHRLNLTGDGQLDFVSADSSGQAGWQFRKMECSVPERHSRD
jgi:hypothetical protein